MGEGTGPGAGGRCRAELFWESGLCWPLSQFQLEHLEGLGVLIPSQKGEGAQDMQPAGDSEAPGSLWKATWNPVLGRGRTWTLFSVGQGKDWCGALGEHRGEQALGLQHQGRRQQLRPQSSCAQR